MIIDAQTQFSKNQAITATGPSTNVYDFGNTMVDAGGRTINLGADSGPGEPIEFYGLVTQSFNNLTSMDVEVITATDAAFTTPISLSKKNYLLAALTAGALLLLPPILQGAKRFLKLQFTVNGTAPTTGTVTAGIMEDLQANVPTADMLPQ